MHLKACEIGDPFLDNEKIYHTLDYSLNFEFNSETEDAFMLKLLAGKIDKELAEFY